MTDEVSQTGTVQPIARLGHGVDGITSEDAGIEQWHRCDYAAGSDEEPEQCVEFYLYDVSSGVVGWCLDSVGLMTYLLFASLDDARAWLAQEGADPIPE